MSKNENGSTLVLLILIMAAIILMGTSLLNITMSQFQIRKFNSEIKQASYLSEDGLNHAYLRVYDLICEAAENSVNRADEYLLTMPGDMVGATNLFNSSYKSYIINNVLSRVYSNSNPYTDITNKSGMIFVGEELKVNISSNYISETGLEKKIIADIIILVPDYLETKLGQTDFTMLLYLINFNI